MYSWVAKTEEIDDLELALEELKAQIDEMPLKANSVGIAYVYYDTDFDELARLMDDNIDFPVIGVSSIAILDKEGYFEYGIELLVLSADDAEFGVGLVGGDNFDNYEEVIEKKYDALRALRPGEKEKLILTYICKNIAVSGDHYSKLFDRLGGGVPVYGGMASDRFEYNKFKIFGGKSAYHYGAVFILVYGNVKPIAVVEYSVSNIRSVSKKITQAEGNTIFKVDNDSFVDVLDKAGLTLEDESGNIALDYMQTPFIVEVPMNEHESVEVLRNIIYLNREDGTAQFLGNVSEGGTIKFSHMRCDDIGKSVNEAFSKLLSELDSSQDYTYSTLICTSCTGRYINLVGDKDTEAKAYKGIIPENISLMGMYSYGELCPIKSEISDNYYNLFHNETFTILAL